MWVADMDDDKLYAYDMTTKAHDAGKDFNTLRAAGNEDLSGITSNGATMWVADRVDGKLYAYDMTTKGAGRGQGLRHPARRRKQAAPRHLVRRDDDVGGGW